MDSNFIYIYEITNHGWNNKKVNANVRRVVDEADLHANVCAFFSLLI